MAANFLRRRNSRTLALIDELSDSGHAT